MHLLSGMSEDIIKELNDLVQLDYDAARTYEQALKHIDDEDEDVRVDLAAFREDHLRHIEDLRDTIWELGGLPIEVERDFKGALLEGMTKLRSATGTLGALKAMRMNEKLTNRAYERALDLSESRGLRALIEANLQDERVHLASIEAHIARFTSAQAIIDEDVGEEEEPGHLEPDMPHVRM
jgi:rubrerythrin